MLKPSAVAIIKASGERVPFDVKKLAWGMERAGASKKLAREAADFVADRVRDGFTTARIWELAHQFLKKRQLPVAARYSLKEAMRRLGPAGYDFEKFVAEILREYGYETELPEMLAGMCVQHEVDVIARKDNKAIMIECKYRNEAGIYVRLKDVMATWARFGDLCEARAAGKCPVALDEVWIVCNTKITSDGLAFGEYKGMKFIGWRYPADRGLEKMIEEKRLYPITILSSVDGRVEERLSAVGILLCRDLMAVDVEKLARQSGLPRIRLEAMRDEVVQILGH